MLFPILSSFSLAVILGFSFVSFVLRSRETRRAITVLHFLLIASSIVLMWLYLMSNAPGPAESMILLIVALGSAGILYAREIASYRLPRWLVVTHGLFSIVGIALLLIAEMSK